MPSKIEYRSPSFEKNSWLDSLKYFVVRMVLLCKEENTTKIILIRRPSSSKLEPNKLAFPGGKVEETSVTETGRQLGENLITAISRELGEELLIGEQPLQVETPKLYEASFNPEQKALTVYGWAYVINPNQLPTLNFVQLSRDESDSELFVFDLNSVPLPEMAFEYGVEYLKFIHQHFPDQLIPLRTNNLHQIMAEFENLAEKMAAEDMVESSDRKEAKNSALWLRYYSRCEKAIHMLGKLDFHNSVDPLSRLNRLNTSFVYNAKHLLKKSELLAFQQSELQSIIDRLSKLMDILERFLKSDVAPRV